METVSCCYYPNRVVLIDDDANFLSQIKMVLDFEKHTYDYMDSPQKALKYINEQVYPSSFLTKLQKGELNGNIDKLHQEIHNPSRHQRISTVVVDYDMPGMNGIEFCKAIKDPHIQKILLTGAADETMAINAFNNGYINSYVKKHGDDTYSDLNNYIDFLSRRYFNLFSTAFIEAASEDYDLGMMDPVLKDFFKDFQKKHHIVEYYLLDWAGSFLCLDNRGNPSGLFMFDDESFTFHDELIGELSEMDSDEKVFTPSLLDDLKNRRKGFCFHYFEDIGFPEMEDLPPYIYPLHKLEAENKIYHWAFVPDIKDIHKEKILSFEKFKAKGR